MTVTQTIEFSAPTGRTLTVNLFAEFSDTLAASAAATERTNCKTLYDAIFTGLTAGRYSCEYVDSIAGPIGSDYVSIGATTGTYEAGNTAQLLTAIEALDVGSGPGPLVIVVPVVDQNNNPLPSASVGFQQGGLPCGSTFTNTGGLATLNPAANITTFIAALAGYASASTTIDVIGNETLPPLVLQQQVVEASVLPGITGFCFCYDGALNPLAGVPHSLRLVSSPNQDVGNSLDAATITVDSAASTGLVQFPGLLIGATYKLQRNGGAWVQFMAKNNSSGNCAMPDPVG